MLDLKEILIPLTEKGIKNLYKNQQSKYWNVTEEGLEHKENGYFISMDRITEPIWISQLRGKTWIDLDDFIQTYFTVLAQKGITELKIDIY